MCAGIGVERQALQAEHKRTEKVTSVHWLTAAGCVQVPLGGRRAGWRAEMAYWVMAHRHTSFWGSSCCCGLQGWEWLGGAPLRHMMHSRRGPCRALVNRGLSLVIHPGKPKALRWSQNIFGLSTNYHDYGSTFLSWNLKPKALSC